MSEYMKYLFFAAIALFSYPRITMHYWDSFLVRKNRSFSSILPWILLSVTQFVAQCSLEGTSFWLSLLNILTVLLVVLYSYESTGLETGFLLAFFVIMWAFVEFTLFSLFHFLNLEYQSFKLLGTASAQILMLAFTHVLSLFANKKENTPIPKRLALLLLLVPIGSFYIMLMLHLTWNNYVLSISISIILLLFNILTFDAYIKFHQYFLRERETAVYAEQLSIISQNMNERKKLMEDFYEEKHNLVNELTALRGSIQRESNEKVLQNLDKILNYQHGMGNISSSGNSTVDAIIDAKYATAKEYGISFHLKICLPEELTIAPSDLGVLLGNALDNAVTAVKDCVSAEKIIQISMGIKKNSLIMVMKNPYEHTIKKNRNGELLSTKSEKGAHGYGIRSILRVVNAYNGDVVIDTDHDCFVLTAVLSLDGF